MAKEKEDKPKAVNETKYEGPGKVISTTGGFVAGGIVGGLAGGLINAVAGNGPLTVPTTTGQKVGSIIAAVVSLAALIIGTVKGFRKAKRGQEQFEANQTMLKNERAQNAALESELINYRNDHGQRILEAREAGKSSNISVGV